ncbi:MAG: mechanosensitive ion channel [Planctomycetales bacterium]|nr:mechanosensitive ion channel [Planctomycetales bacterium]
MTGTARVQIWDGVLTSANRGMIALAFFLCVAELHAQASAQSDPQFDSRSIEARLASAETSSDLNDTTRPYVVEQFQQALSEIQAFRTEQARLETLKADIRDAPENTETLRNELATTQADSRDVPEADLKSAKTEADAEKILSEHQTLLDAARRELNSVENKILGRPEQRTKFAKSVSANEALIETLRSPVKDPQEVDLPASFEDAPRQLRAIKLAVAKLKIEVANQELAYLDATNEFFSLKREQDRREVLRLERAVEQWTQRAAEVRQKSIEQQAVDASEKTFVDELQYLVEENLKLTKKREETATAIEDARTKAAETSALLEKLDNEFKRISTSLKSRTYVSEAVGGMLRTNRRKLPNVRQRKQENVNLKTEKYDAQYMQIVVDEELAEFGDFQRRLDLELRKLQATLTAARIEELKPQVRELLTDRHATLKSLETDYDTYVKVLESLDINEDSLISLVERYAAFVDERVLWIRSSPPVNVEDVTHMVKAIRWLMWSPWSELLGKLERSVLHRRLTNIAWLTGMIGLLIYRMRFRDHVNDLGRQAASRTCRDFAITLEVLAYTAARAVTWPLIFWWLSWNLSYVRDEIAGHLSEAFLVIAILSYPILFWWRAVRVHGLAHAHLGWSDQKRHTTEQSLRLVIPLIIPFIALFYFFADSNYEKSAGRFCFVVGMLGIALCVRKLTSPKTGIFTNYLQTHRDQWFDQLTPIWYPALTLIPISFAVLALMGYQYTAGELLQRFYITAAFLSVLYLLQAVCLRWLLVNRRRLAMQQARERLEQLKAMHEEGITSSETIVHSPDDGVTESAQIDLSAVSLQSIRLLSSVTTISALVGIYAIWIAVLPALAKLDEYKLWQTSVDISVVETAESSDAAATDSGSSERVTDANWITLGKLIAALVTVAMTMIAVQNIPGLMEMALLQHLPIDPAVRYAIKSVTRYLIIIVGFAMAFSRIGIGWSKVQWLAAAISVGLGFGLQEIFANFMSGLILLFERPLRAGDVVTVGDVSGRVVQIKTRATTVRDWDCKELIVPNKEFITGKVLNWTLSDTVTRIVVKVGIAYGADIKLARQIILDVANEHPEVVDDPEASVTFGAFGDSALDFTLRCYVPNIDNRLATIHELHESIHDRLKAAGIEIPFPQRDVHIRSNENPAPGGPPKRHPA